MNDCKQVLEEYLHLGKASLKVTNLCSTEQGLNNVVRVMEDFKVSENCTAEETLCQIEEFFNAD